MLSAPSTAMFALELRLASELKGTPVRLIAPGTAASRRLRLLVSRRGRGPRPNSLSIRRDPAKPASGKAGTLTIS